MNSPTLPRLLLTLTITSVAAYGTWALAARPGDFQFYWRGAQLWLGGVDPYAMRPFTPRWPLQDRLFYPLPALILTAPFAALEQRAAHFAFIATAAGLLSWRLTRDALWPLLLFLTPSFLMAAMFGQWSPWLVFGALVPSAGFFLAAKPTLGLACFLYRPSWRGVLMGAGITFLSVGLMPDWPAKWLANLQMVTAHVPPMLEPGGFVLVLGLLRWRQREARLLIAMACVPQLGVWADQLALFLVCRTRSEATLYALGSGTAFLTWCALMFRQSPAETLFPEPFVMLGCYWTALYVVLRRPNQGTVPRWLERAVSAWPEWIRGAASRP